MPSGRGASDIHFEPYEEDYRVRFRIDGLLKAVAKAPNKLNQRIAARLKVMSQLDIAEKRVPQDGRIKLNLSKTKQVDFRVSTLPTLFGEKVVLRILMAARQSWVSTNSVTKLTNKRFLWKQSTNPMEWYWSLVRPVSGKTVSLYTALGILNDETRNISTAEDPVEIRLQGVNQVQQNNKRGMTFAAALRSFLRQDPDVIMVGEIRDLETAEIAHQSRTDRPHGALHTTYQRCTANHRTPHEHGDCTIQHHFIRDLSDCTAIGTEISDKRKRPVQLPKNALLAARIHSRTN